MVTHLWEMFMQKLLTVRALYICLVKFVVIGFPTISLACNTVATLIAINDRLRNFTLGTGLAKWPNQLPTPKKVPKLALVETRLIWLYSH